MKYSEWVLTIPDAIRNDVVWKLEAYRIALYLSDLSWLDTEEILACKRYSLADQLYRSVGSVSANIIEGYSRISMKEKVRFYEISLGSAREARDWYFKSRHIIGSDKATARINMITSIIRLLQTMIRDQRIKS